MFRQFLVASLRQAIPYGLFIAVSGGKLYAFGKLAGLAVPSLTFAIVTAGSVLIASCWTLLLPHKPRALFLWLLMLLLSAAIFSDLLYYRYFGDFLTVPVVMQARQAGAVAGSILHLVRWPDAVLWIDLAITAPWVWRTLRVRTERFGFRRSRRRSRAALRAAAALTAAAVGAFMVIQPIHAYIDKRGSNLFANNWWNVSVYNVTGLLGFHYYDARNYVRERLAARQGLSEERILEVRAWFAERGNLPQSKMFGCCEGCSVLLVQAEALQGFVIGSRIGGQEITPNLNKLAEETAYYERFYHQVGQGRTVDAEFLANVSLHPLPSGSVYRRYPHHAYDSLPRVLKDELGYSSYVFHAYKKSFWNRRVMYRQYGIDRFYGQEDFDEGEKAGWALGDEAMLQQMADRLKEAPEPFYAMAVTLSSHHPYTNIPARHRTLPVGELEGTLEGNYLHAVHYADHAIGRLVDRLKKEGLWDNMIFVLYGDHDAGLEQAEKLAGMLGLPADPLSLTEMKLRVPLFLHMPGDPFKGVSSEPAGMIDIAPTVLGLLGVSREGKLHMGRDLLAVSEGIKGADSAADKHRHEPQDRLVVFRNGSFTDGKRLYRAGIDGAFSRGTCYDVEKRKEIEISACRAGFDEAVRRLRMSDDVIAAMNEITAD